MGDDPRIMSSSPMVTRLRTLAVQMAPAEERKILRLMLKMIRDLPHHWDKQHPGFGRCDARMRERKKTEIRMLTRLYQRYDPTATSCTVTKKLSALISSYIQERQRVKLQQLLRPNGSIRNYKSSLWQYDDLRFMDETIDVPESMLAAEQSQSRDLDEAGPSSSHGQKVALKASHAASTSSDLRSSTHNAPKQNTVSLESDNNTQVYLKTRANAVYEPNKVQQETEDTCTSDIIEPNKDLINENNDIESQFINQDGVRAIEKFVNYKLNHIDKSQMVIAQKLIFEVLQNAQSGKLTDQSFIQVKADKTLRTEPDPIGNTEKI